MNLLVTIFKCYLNILKTIFFPFYILEIFYTSIKKFCLFYVNLFIPSTPDPISFLLYPFILLRNQINELCEYIIKKIYYCSKGCVKLAFLTFIFLLNSIIFTLICLSFISIPKTIDKNLTFSLFQDKALYSKQIINCHENSCVNDINMNNEYKVYLELNILRNEGSVNLGNFETEFHLINEKKERKSVKVVSFLDQCDQITEHSKNILLLPLKILGAFKQDHITITFHENLSLIFFNLIKIKIFIKSTLLKVGHARLVFQPIIGWVKFFIHYSKLFTIPMIFTSCFFFQVFLYLFKMAIDKYYVNGYTIFE
jgi:hypothetical protein